MTLSKSEFLARAEATLAGLEGAVLEALSHHGEPSVDSLAGVFKGEAPLRPEELAEALCPGPLTDIGFAAVALRDFLPRVDAVLETEVSEARVVTGNAHAPGSLLVTCPLLGAVPDLRPENQPGGSNTRVGPNFRRLPVSVGRDQRWLCADM
ncbi:hypothetical protein D7W81_05745, partial [Corallococcus aberystwythensis]